MKKQISNLGRQLSKTELKEIKGGDWIYCNNPGSYGQCTQQECESLGGIWYGCIGQCHENIPHFPPC